MLLVIPIMLSSGTFRINTQGAATPADADVFLLEDQNDSWNAKKVTATNLAAYIAAEIQGVSMTLTAVTIDNDAGTNAISNIGNADIKAAAGIEFSKMEALTNDRVCVTSGDEVTAGDVTTTELAILDDLQPTKTELAICDGAQNESVYDFGNGVAIKSNGSIIANFDATITNSVYPGTDDTYDFGTVGVEWQDGYFDGTVYADALDFNGTAITATGAELNYTDGCTGDINGKGQGLTKRTGVTITGDTTLGASDEGFVPCDTSGGNIDLTLPAIGLSNAGVVYLITLTTGGNNLRILDNGADAGFSMATGDDTQATGTSITFSTAGDCVVLRSPGYTGGRWIILGGYGIDLP